MSKSDSEPVSDESNMLSAAFEVDGDVLEAAEVVDALGVPSYMCLHLCLKKKEYVNILVSFSLEGSFIFNAEKCLHFHSYLMDDGKCIL